MARQWDRPAPCYSPKTENGSHSVRSALSVRPSCRACFAHSLRFLLLVARSVSVYAFRPPPVAGCIKPSARATSNVKGNLLPPCRLPRPRGQQAGSKGQQTMTACSPALCSGLVLVLLRLAIVTVSFLHCPCFASVSDASRKDQWKPARSLRRWPRPGAPNGRGHPSPGRLCVGVEESGHDGGRYRHA